MYYTFFYFKMLRRSWNRALLSFTVVFCVSTIVTCFGRLILTFERFDWKKVKKNLLPNQELKNLKSHSSWKKSTYIVVCLLICTLKYIWGVNKYISKYISKDDVYTKCASYTFHCIQICFGKAFQWISNTFHEMQFWSLFWSIFLKCIL